MQKDSEPFPWALVDFRAACVGVGPDGSTLFLDGRKQTFALVGLPFTANADSASKVFVTSSKVA